MSHDAPPEFLLHAPAVGEPVTTIFVRPQILLVAPDDLDCRWLKALFRALGANCRTAANGMEALFVLETCGTFALICADIDTRPATWLGLGRLLGNRHRSDPVPVVFFGNPEDPHGPAAALSGQVDGWADRRRMRLAWTSKILAGLIGFEP